MCMATLSSSSISNLSRFTGCTSLQWAQKNPTRPYPSSFNVLSDPDPDHKLHATGEGSDCRATVSPRACAVSLQQFYPRVLVYIILTFKYIKKKDLYFCALLNIQANIVSWHELIKPQQVILICSLVLLYCGHVVIC